MLSDPNHYAYSAIIDREPLKMPGDARIAVFIVPNVEYLEFLPPNNTGLILKIRASSWEKQRLTISHLY